MGTLRRVGASAALAILAVGAGSVPPLQKGKPRAVGGTKRGRQLTNKYYKGNRSHSNPGVTGDKEQERALRCYMSYHMPNGQLRSTPTMCQVSKKKYAEMLENGELLALA